MDDGAALLAAIIAFPDEDVPRLMYADWLTENGQADRAEFIRVQCELARSPECDLCQTPGGRGADSRYRTGCRCETLRDRERELVNGFNRDKVDFCPRAFPGVRLIGLDLSWYRGENALGTVRRGFVHAITCPAADWLKFADAILAAHPVREVTLTTWPTIRSVNEWEVRKFGRSSAFGFYAIAADMLKDTWPTVKTWHLPADTSRFEVGTNTHLRDIMAAMRRDFGPLIRPGTSALPLIE